MPKKKRPYKRNIQKLRRTQGCLTDCVAYMLNVHPQRVPFFIYPREGWMRRFKAYWRRQGYKVYWTNTDRVPARGMHLVCGKSLAWKTAAHAVVYKNGKCVFDPDTDSRWKASRITHRLIVERIA